MSGALKMKIKVVHRNHYLIVLNIFLIVLLILGMAITLINYGIEYRRAKQLEKLYYNSVSLIGFTKSKLLTERQLLNKMKVVSAKELKDKKLIPISHSEASFKITSKAAKVGIDTTNNKQYKLIPIPWSDNRLTIIDYIERENKLVYELSQQFIVTHNVVGSNAIQLENVEIQETSANKDVEVKIEKTYQDVFKNQNILYNKNKVWFGAGIMYNIEPIETHNYLSQFYLTGKYHIYNMELIAGISLEPAIMVGVIINF